MTDIEFDNFLDYQSLGYQDEDIQQGYDQWPGTSFLESYAAAPIDASSWDDIEHIYTGLHKSVDQVVAQISARTPPRLDQIREQNRKLIDKLKTLDSTITGDPRDVVPDSESRAYSSASTSDSNLVSSGGKRRRVSHATTDPENLNA